jgi:hypothetical protein
MVSACPPDGHPVALAPGRWTDGLVAYLCRSGFAVRGTALPVLYTRGRVEVEVSGFVTVRRYADSHFRLIDWAVSLSPGTPAVVLVALLRTAEEPPTGLPPAGSAPPPEPDR